MSKGLLFVAVIALMDVVAQNFQKDKNDDFDHHDDQTIQKYHDFHYLEKYDRILRKSTEEYCATCCFHLFQLSVVFPTFSYTNNNYH